MTNEGNKSFKHVKAAADAAAVVAAARITPKLRKSCDFCCMRKRRCDGKRPCRPTLSASPATGLVGLEENAFLGTFFSCLGFLPLACERTVRQGLVDTMLGARRKRAEQLKQSLACEVTAPGTAGVDADAISRRDPGTAESALPGASRSSKDEGHPRSDAAAAAQEEPDKVDDKDDGANDSPRAAAVCELWCAIAIGALIQGQPPERVASYKFSAWTALSKCFDHIAPETARAYAVMAYLHNFLRNDKMFYRYLKMAKGIVDVLSPEEAQTAQSIEQVLMKIVDKRMFHTSSVNPQELGLLCENYCKDELPPLKVPSIIQKEKLCSLLIQADVKMYQAFLRDWRNHEQPAVAESSRQRKREDGRPPLDATTPRTPDADRPSANPDASALLKREKEENVSKGEGWATPAEAAVPSGAGKIGDGQTFRPRLLPAPTDNVMMCVQECMELFGRMKDSATVPEIRNGAGGLLVKAFQGFMEIRGGDKRVGARNVIECAHILVAFPGLCRVSRWSHICHCLLGFLAAMGSSELYEKLRQAYNKVLIGNAPAVPPLEEWSVATVCDHIFCEDSEASVKMQMGATRRRDEVTRSESVTVARGSKDGEAARQQQEKLEGQHQEKQLQEKRAEEHREQPERAEVTRSESATFAQGSMDGEEKLEGQQQQRERQNKHQEKQWQENRAEKHREQPHQKQQRRQQEMDEHKKRQRQQLQQQEEQRQQQKEQRQREEEQRQQLQQQEEQRQREEEQRQQLQQLEEQRQQQEEQRQREEEQKNKHEEQQQWQQQQQLQQQQQNLQRQQQELQQQQLLLQRQQHQLQRQQQLQQDQDQLQRLEEQAKKHQEQQQYPQRQQQRQEQQQQQLQRQQQLQWQQQIQRQQQLRWQQQQQQQPQQECQQHQPKREQVGMERVQEPAEVLSRQSFLRGACPENCPTTTSLWEYEVPHHGYEAIPEFPNQAFLTRGAENQEALVCATGSARDREPGSSSTNPQASSRDPQTVLLPSGGASSSPMQLLPIGYGVEDCCTCYHHRGKQNGDERYGTEHNSNDHHCGECYDDGGGIQQQQGDRPFEVWRPSPDCDPAAGPPTSPLRGLWA